VQNVNDILEASFGDDDFVIPNDAKFPIPL